MYIYIYIYIFIYIHIYSNIFFHIWCKTSNKSPTQSAWIKNRTDLQFRETGKPYVQNNLN